MGVETSDRALLAEASAGDGDAFRLLFDRYSRELHVHCYRLLGSFQDAEDLVQESFLRAWRRRGSVENGGNLRAWLYRIATNACLDLIRRRPRRVLPPDVAPPSDPTPEPAPALTEVPWLEPYPDALLDEPHGQLVTRETIEIAFLAAIQHLPARQRAALIYRDVLRWSAAETASALDSSVASVNSALQRARRTLRGLLPDDALDWPSAHPSNPDEKALLERYVKAWEEADVPALAGLLTEDATMSMPPSPSWYRGRAAIAQFHAERVFGPAAVGELRLVQARANRQPAFAVYLQANGEADFDPLAIKVLTVRGGLVSEITGFVDVALFPRFGLEPRLRPA